ncbi:MAG: drug resistance transporter, EmrB/QacA subfamily [Actinomycetia bacterium]|nr:drug resistance transporter, EmrB/QacA subfamily [Actinomycetes bacterium]
MSNADRAYDRRWWILLVLCLSLVVITLDNTILNVAIPTLQRDLNANTSQLQWMVDAYTLVFAGLLLTAGSLGDRFGRRGALQLGLAIFALGSLASAVVTTADQLIATRALMGIGGALIMPSTLSILTNVFPAHERGRAIGIWAGVSAIGIALGPLAGGFLLSHFYWGSIFLVNIPIAAVAIVAGIFLMPNSKDPHPGKLDPVGAGLSIAGLFALVYAIIEAPQDGWTDPTIVTMFAAAAVLLVVFAIWETRSTHPMLDVTFFKNPRFTAASAGITLVFFALFGYTFLLTQYFQLVLGYSAIKTGFALLPFALILMITAPTSSRIVDRFGTKLVVATGLSLVTLGMLLQTGLQVSSSYLDVIWRMAVIAFGMGLTLAPSTESIMGSLPLAKAGVGSAVNDTTRQVGGALGVAIIGSALSSYYGSHIVHALTGKYPPNVVAAAKSSIGGAIDAASTLGNAGKPVAAAAKAAFVGGLHRGALVASISALIGATVAALYLPARAPRAEIEEQEAELAAEIGAGHVHSEGGHADGQQADGQRADGPPADGQRADGQSAPAIDPTPSA